MFLSIIIPAYNEEKYLPETILNLHQIFQSAAFSWELIVCDNNSSDQTSSIAKKMSAKVIHEPMNQISRARNTGASLAQGEWLLFLDADTHPCTELINNMLEIIWSGKYLGCGATLQIVGGTLFNKLRLERVNLIFRLLNLSGGAFLLCSRRAFEAIDGFSHDLFAYEEVDFVRRLKKYGKTQGKKFVVLSQHPVKTSGRKGELNVPSIVRLILSNIAGLLLFFLHFILPKKWIRKIGPGLLGYWYRVNR